MAYAHGFIYLLDNKAMPGLIKIGFSMRHPRERLDELSNATACPLPFDLLAWFGAIEPAVVESDIHAEMSTHRVNDKREFFRMTYREAQDLIRRWYDPHRDGAFLDRLDMLASAEEEDERKRMGAFCDR